MDGVDLDSRLQRRLEALSEAVPVMPSRPAMAPMAKPRPAPDYRRSTGLGLPGLAVIGVLLGVVSLAGLLFLGGSISGVLNTVGGGLPADPPGYIRTVARSTDRDVPCGTDGEHCASPVPTIDPAVASLAVPLRVASASVTVDHVGHYSVPLGTAVLPNGILTDATFTLEGPLQPTIELEPSVVYLVVTGDDGKPLLGIYEQGWRPGVEEVTASLEFDVLAVDAPAALQFADIVVR